MSFREFFVGATKIATALALSVVALSALGWGIYAYGEHRQNEANAPLATPKDWPPITIEALENSTADLSTIWRGNRVSFKFTIVGYPQKVKAAMEDLSGFSNPAFTLIFLDKDGFKIFEHELPLSGMTRVIDEKGSGRGLSARGDFYLDADSYRHAVDVTLSWRL